MKVHWLALLLLKINHVKAMAPSPPHESRRIWVLTVASHETGALENLRNSAAWSGVKFRQLGNETRFTRTGIKLEFFMDALVDGTIPDNDVVLCADGYDVMLTGKEADLLDTFDLFRTDIVIAGERGCWPMVYCSEMVERTYNKTMLSSGPFPFVNSGLIIGSAHALRGAIREILRFPVFEDQSAWTYFYLNNEDPRRISVDDRGRMFLCLTLRNATTEFFFDTSKGGKWLDLVTMERPLVLHGNGDDGIENLMFMVEKHSPPFPVCRHCWLKNISMPMKEKDRWWVSTEPDALAPRAGGKLLLLNFYYNQATMAFRAGEDEIAKQNFAHVYAMYAGVEDVMTEELKTNVLTSLSRFAYALSENSESESDQNKFN